METVAPTTLSLPHVHTTTQALQLGNTAVPTLGQAASTYEPLVTLSTVFCTRRAKHNPMCLLRRWGRKGLSDFPSKAEFGPLSRDYGCAGHGRGYNASHPGTEVRWRLSSCSYSLQPVRTGFMVSLFTQYTSGRSRSPYYWLFCRSLSHHRQRQNEFQSRGPFLGASF